VTYLVDTDRMHTHTAKKVRLEWEFLGNMVGYSVYGYMIYIVLFYTS
jgi:hypothetical protein